MPALRANAAPCFDYVYVESNEGGSSGGHAAIRFGDYAYHFEYESPGMLRLHRDQWRAFVYQYAGLENRPIHLSRVDTSADTCARLRDRFSAAHVIQDKQFDLLDDARVDRELFETLLDKSAPPRIRLPGVGYFFPDGDVTGPGDYNATLLSLRERVQRQYGAGFVHQRLAAIERELAELEPTTIDATDFAADAYPVAGYAFSTRYRDLLVGWFALRALDRALPLQPGSTVTAPGDAFGLNPTASATLRVFSQQLSDELVRLLHSQRPDWGFALIIGMARLSALDESEQLGRLVLLDAFPSNPTRIPRARLDRSGWLTDLLDEAHDEWQTARARAFEGTLG
ncbi:MAG TPA: hypothetical protein VL403_05390, partial [Candidatus Kryptonia bacterium]|nr:hypothetical protein [Candidatus Kryptonia bacterium]